MYHYSLAPKIPFTEALKLCQAVGVYNLESDGTLDGKAFADLTPAEREDAREALILSGVRIVSARLSCDLHDDAALRAYLAAAHLLHVENVLAPIPTTNDLNVYIDTLKMAARYAQSYGIGFLIANDPDSVLKTEANLAQAVKALSAYDCGAVFDTIAYQKTGAYPFFGALYSSHIKNQIRIIRLGDLNNAYQPVPLAHGICGIRECVSLLLARSFNGYFSLSDTYGQQSAEDWRSLLSDARQMLMNM